MNKGKLNPDKTEVTLVGKGEILKGVMFPTFDGVQLTSPIGVTQDPALLLESPAAKNAFFHLQLAWKMNLCLN